MNSDFKRQAIINHVVMLNLLKLRFISIQTSFRDSKLFRSGISLELVVYRMNINLLGKIQNCF